MTDQSRVEAVARALAEATGWVWDGLREDQKGYWAECAQAAIEANDAWLKGRGWKAVPREADGKMSEIGWEYWSSCEVTWAAMYDAAPSPEGPDQ